MAEGAQDSSERFGSIGWEEFRAFPDKVKADLIDVWGKEGNERRVDSAAEAMNALVENYGVGRPNRSVSKALARAGSLPAVRSFFERCRKEEDSKGAGALPNRKREPWSFGVEAMLALRRGRSDVAADFVEVSEKLSDVLSLRNSAGKDERFHFVELALQLGEKGLVEKAFERDPKALAGLFESSSATRSETASDTAKDLAGPGRWREGAETGELTERQEAAFVRFVEMCALARKAGVKNPASTVPDDCATALIYSLSRSTRETAENFFGPARRRKILDDDAKKSRSNSFFVTDRVFPTRDKALIDEALGFFGVDKLASEADTELPSCGSLAMRAISKGGVEALVCLLEAAKASDPFLPDRLLSHGAWIWRSTDRQRRKKGDALAFCVAEGQLDCARAILEFDPSVNRTYAREAVKYLKGRQEKEAVEAVCVWESLLLEDELGRSAKESAQAPKARPRSGL